MQNHQIPHPQYFQTAEIRQHAPTGALLNSNSTHPRHQIKLDQQNQVGTHFVQHSTRMSAPQHTNNPAAQQQQQLPPAPIHQQQLQHHQPQLVNQQSHMLNASQNQQSSTQTAMKYQQHSQPPLTNPQNSFIVQQHQNPGQYQQQVQGPQIQQNNGNIKHQLNPGQLTSQQHQGHFQPQLHQTQMYQQQNQSSQQPQSSNSQFYLQQNQNQAQQQQVQYHSGPHCSQAQLQHLQPGQPQQQQQGQPQQQQGHPQQQQQGHPQQQQQGHLQQQQRQPQQQQGHPQQQQQGHPQQQQQGHPQQQGQPQQQQQGHPQQQQQGHPQQQQQGQPQHYNNQGQPQYFNNQGQPQSYNNQGQPQPHNNYGQPQPYNNQSQLQQHNSQGQPQQYNNQGQMEQQKTQSQPQQQQTQNQVQQQQYHNHPQQQHKQSHVQQQIHQEHLHLQPNPGQSESLIPPSQLQQQQQQNSDNQLGCSSLSTEQNDLVSSFPLKDTLHADYELLCVPVSELQKIDPETTIIIARPRRQKGAEIRPTDRETELNSPADPNLEKIPLAFEKSKVPPPSDEYGNQMRQTNLQPANPTSSFQNTNSSFNFDSTAPLQNLPSYSYETDQGSNFKSLEQAQEGQYENQPISQANSTYPTTQPNSLNSNGALTFQNQSCTPTINASVPVQYCQDLGHLSVNFQGSDVFHVNQPQILYPPQEITMACNSNHTQQSNEALLGPQFLASVDNSGQNLHPIGFEHLQATDPQEDYPMTEDETTETPMPPEELHHLFRPPTPPKEDSTINILLLGETGVGKSTWINAFANYLTYPSLEKAAKSPLKVLIPSQFTMSNDKYDTINVAVGTMDSNEVHTSGQSATQHPVSYTFKTAEGTLVRVIDTPGIGDTRGREQDKANFQNIMNHLSHVGQIHGICILLKPNNARLNVLFEFCIKELLNQLHRDAAANIVFCFTNARSTFYRPGDTLVSLKAFLRNSAEPSLIQLNKSTIYCLDNEAFRFLAAIQQGQVFGEADYRNFGESWMTSVRETQRLVSYFQTVAPHGTQNTVTLHRTRLVLNKLAKPLVEVSQNIQTNIGLLHDRVRELEGLSEQNADLKNKLRIPQIDLQTIQLEHPRTVCAHRDCTERIPVYETAVENQVCTTHYKQICHDQCSVKGVETGVTNCQELQQCSCMGMGGFCTECGHSWNVHVHITYEVKQTVVETIDRNIATNLQTTEGRLEAIRTFVEGCKNRQDSLKKEQKSIVQAAAIFSVFLKDNSITKYNNALVVHLDHEIGIELSKSQHGGLHSTYEALQKLKKRYLEEERKYAEEKNIISLDYIHKLLGQLCQLPLTGRKINEAIVKACETEKLSYNEKSFVSGELQETEI